MRARFFRGRPALLLVISGCLVALAGCAEPEAPITPPAARSVTATSMAAPTTPAAPGPASPSASTVTASATPYRDPVTGFTCALPAGWTRRESTDPGGVVATRPDGATLTRCVRIRSADDSVDAITSRSQALTKAGWTMSARETAPTGVVLRGTDGARDFYGLYQGTGTSTVASEWEYPGTERAAFEPLLAAAGRTLSS